MQLFFWMCQMNILFRHCSQPGNLTTIFFNFFLPPADASDDVCQAPKGNGWNTPYKWKHSRAGPQKPGWGLNGKGSERRFPKLHCWEMCSDRCPAHAAAAPSSASGYPAFHRGLNAQGCAYRHMAIPWTTGMVSEHICTKKFQDSECIGDLELVLH